MLKIFFFLYRVCTLCIVKVGDVMLMNFYNFFVTSVFHVIHVQVCTLFVCNYMHEIKFLIKLKCISNFSFIDISLILFIIICVLTLIIMSIVSVVVIILWRKRRTNGYTLTPLQLRQMQDDLIEQTTRL